MKPALLAALALSCAGAPSSPAAPVFSAQASQALLSTSGSLEVQVFEELDWPVSRGVNSLRLGVSSDAGVDVGTLNLAVTPWMVVMGHGSAVTPTVTPDDGGFLVSNIALAMPGRWELRFDFGGSSTDRAIATFDIQ